ncbi:hypothetical protein FA15DRAFT_681894 [Coprinopsis marcescibilis]|uniref:PalH-domain-containing protein n=1 Tax=Coprinopsis marcescibilis TaxID=230819 RepID=A0A5C3KNQ8_COPMA|nr:hypothetical protein FA15DRAFT_681894 [Coprinopsis marcescibilis]
MSYKALFKWALFALMTGLLQAAEDTSRPDYYQDPYLEFRPIFARSLPVQILLTGVVLTLTAVLFIHLMFTAQYHWPLAPVNYVLQLSGVTTLLISLIATIHVVLSATFAQSERWPYMLDYIAVNVPPPLDTQVDTNVWSMAERATWLVMNASTSGLIQITHIQFLTLLYPSRLEGRLIFTLLGPLAVLAAVMQLVPISSDQNVNTIASAVRNVCNATLSLLFTVALFIWGLLVNRKQAWRTDGGTAAFGAAALVLAVVSTALNFFYVHREDEFVWLPGLMWAVILWQSFLGWWWWVGAGSGAGLASPEEMEDRLEREARREERRKRARERRGETRSKASKVWNGMTGALSTRDRAHSTASQSRASDEITTRNRIRASRRQSSEVENEDDSRAPSPTPSIASTLSATSVVSYNTLPKSLPQFIHQWYASLRREHNAAARRQDAERVQRIRELERNGTQRAPPAGSGWGLGSFGWIIASQSSDSNKRNAKGRSLSPSASRSRSRDRRARPSRADTEDVELGEIVRVRRSMIGMRSSSSDQGVDSHPEGTTSTDPVNRIRGEEAIDGNSESQATNRERRRGTLRISLPDSPSRKARPTPGSSPNSPDVENPEDSRPNSIWWWGPLRRWRLQDSTSYR